jgi:hypothetical protein
MIYLAILAALLLSSIAAWFSILGLTAIFPASYWSIVTMASSLEVAKVISVVWLHQHWEKLTALIKVYLSIAIIVLMMITSIGVFGFLSRSHIENQLKIDTGIGQQIAILDQKYDSVVAELNIADNDLKAYDDEYQKLLDASKRRKDVRRTIDEKKKGRDEKVAKREEILKKLSDIEQEKIKLKGQFKIEEVELGPIKYITKLFNDKANVDTMEMVVTYLIIIIVLVFDPLAVILLLSVSNVLKHNKLADTQQDKLSKVGSRKAKTKRRVTVVDNSDIFKMDK